MNVKSLSQKYFKSTKDFIKSLSKAELIISSLNILISIIFFIVMSSIKDNKGVYGITTWQVWIGLLANIFNIVSVILAVKLRVSTYIWGIMACIFMGAFSFDNRLFGTMITYWVICICSQTLLYIQWKRKSDDKVSVKPLQMDWFLFAVYTFIIVILAVCFSFVQYAIPEFSKFWSNSEEIKYEIALFDSLGFFFIIGTIYLLWNRYNQVWYIYLSADISWIILWIIKLSYACMSNDTSSIVGSINMLLALISMVALNVSGMINWKTKK